MKTLIIGFSVSGRACAKLLHSQGEEVLVVDRKAKEMAVEGVLGEEAPICWEEVGRVVVSPGVSLQHGHILEARRRGIKVLGEAEFAFRFLKNRAIGITGTNGKTTVAMLMAHILNASGKKARAVGNIGLSLSEYALCPNQDEILVVELSSYQLETLEKKCLDAAVCLNITPDHLERHGSMEGYARAKSRIGRCVKEGGELYVSKGVACEFGELFLGARVYEEVLSPVVAISSIRYIQLGLPELPNIQAVYPLCRYFGVSDEEFLQGLKSFRKPAHRIEYLGEWKGFSFYNDSKATNIDAVMYAISLLEGPITLLAGGVDKGASYSPWIEAFGSKVHRIVAFGQAAPKMEAELGSAFSFVRKESMEEALLAAVAMAKAPMVIVLSPGCSSFDAFQNFEHRGNEFKRMVEEKIWIEEKRSSLQC